MPNRRLTILKAWSQFPDPQLSGDDTSLHYEGERAKGCSYVAIYMWEEGRYNHYKHGETICCSEIV